MRYIPIVFVLLFSVGVLVGCGEKAKEAADVVVEQATGLGALEIKKQTDKDLAIIRAKAVFNVQNSQGMDMSSGPCLSNDLMPDWVLDVAHNPRQEIDNLPENQCASYLEGKANHFVELDPDGNLIKVQ